MLSENPDVIKIDTTGCQTTRPLVTKMAGKCYNVASLLIGMIFKTFSKRIRRCSADGRKRYENDVWPQIFLETEQNSSVFV